MGCSGCRIVYTKGRLRRAYLLCFALVFLGRLERLADLHDVFLGGRGILSERLFELLCLAGGNGRRGVGYVHVGCTVHVVVVTVLYRKVRLVPPNYAGLAVTSYWSRSTFPAHPRRS